MNFQKHEVAWDKEKIERFWNYYVSNQNLSEISIAKENSEELIKIIRKRIKKDGENLDYGCGGGYLMGSLIQNEIQCCGLDSSIESLNKVKNNFKENKFFKGIILSEEIPHKNIDDEKFDFVFLIETLEHILPERLNSFIKELNRLIKKDGYIFITVPNNENLISKQIICPDCGCVFHRVQHQNSFDTISLTEIMNKFGFKKIECKPTLFSKNKNIFNKIKYSSNFIISKLTNTNQFNPHLYYIGKKIKNLN